MSDRHVQAQMGLVMARQMQTVLERQRTISSQLADQVAKNGEATGTIEIAGAGEMIADVAFPLSFYQKPVFTFGFELGPSAYLVQGDFPIGTATVANWTTRQLGETLTYVGARLAIVLIGINAPGWCHFVFRGRSLTAPTGAM